FLIAFAHLDVHLDRIPGLHCGPPLDGLSPFDDFNKVHDPTPFLALLARHVTPRASSAARHPNPRRSANPAGVPAFVSTPRAAAIARSRRGAPRAAPPAP